MKHNDVCPIDLHITYEYLPVQQQSNILHSLGSMYLGFLVLQSKRTAWPLFPLERYNYVSPFLGPPLCIYSAITGDSITFKFDIERKIFPTILFNEGDLTVLFPRWYAAAILAAATLAWGIDRYKDFLDIQKSRLEINKLEKEIAHFDMARLKDPTDPLYNYMGTNINLFHYEINQVNITSVKINGVDVKGKKTKQK